MLPAYAVADVYDKALTLTIKLTHAYGKALTLTVKLTHAYGKSTHAYDKSVCFL